MSLCIHSNIYSHCMTCSPPKQSKKDEHDRPPQRAPQLIDYEVAKKDFESENPGQTYDNLPTRKRNALAKDQMFHREYHDLCRAIMGK